MRPEIRFKDFTEDWEQRKYSDVIDLLSGQDFNPNEYNESNNGIPYMTGASCIVDGKTVENRWTTVPRCIAHEGDVLLVCKGSGYGTIARLSQEKAHIARQFMDLQTKEGLNQTFNFYLAHSVVKEIKKDARGLIAGIDRAAVLRQNVIIPSESEQQKMSEYFSNIDHLIILHQRKHKRLVNIKKSMLTLMFPQEGSKVPEIRFKGFTDDWEQRKFSELCDMVTVGIANSATHAYSDSGIVMFRNQNIKPNFLDDNDIIHINPEFEARYKNKRLKKNDLLVARTGYPGTACVVPEKYENSQTFTTLIARPKNNVNPYFLCQYLNSDIGVKYFETTQIGGGQKNSGAGILNEMPIMLPSVVEEEARIADYFAHLDHLITLHQREIEKLQDVKKSLLSKMFV